MYFAWTLHEHASLIRISHLLYAVSFSLGPYCTHREYMLRIVDVSTNLFYSYVLFFSFLSRDVGAVVGTFGWVSNFLPPHLRAKMHNMAWQSIDQPGKNNDHLQLRVEGNFSVHWRLFFVYIYLSFGGKKITDTNNKKLFLWKQKNNPRFLNLFHIFSSHSSSSYSPSPPPFFFFFPSSYWFYFRCVPLSFISIL